MMGAATRRSRRQLTLVAAGHEGNVQKELSHEEPTGVVLKVVDITELEFYRKLAKSKEPLKKFIPEFVGETILDGEKFLRLRNVSSSFRAPYVMDCKIGTRTFLEKETYITKPREDLFKRASTHYAHLLTEEEKEICSITKYRWMNIHDECSTTQGLGFRIDGVAGKRRIEKTRLAQLMTREDVVDLFLQEFLPRVTESSFRPEFTRRAIVRTLVKKLKEFRTSLEESALLQNLEVIGSSLLVVADGDGRCGIYLIDFAKTNPLPNDVRITHRNPWVLGNHEDGILIGVDNLVSVIEEVEQRVCEECNELSRETKRFRLDKWLRGFFHFCVCDPSFQRERTQQTEELIVTSPTTGSTASSKAAMSPPERSLSVPLTDRNEMSPLPRLYVSETSSFTIVGKSRRLQRLTSDNTETATYATTEAATISSPSHEGISSPERGKSAILRETRRFTSDSKTRETDNSIDD